MVFFDEMQSSRLVPSASRLPSGLRPLIIAAPSSGCGKTTVTLALLAALKRRGFRVAPFKVGPDYIDPGHHAAACGRISRNLDGWMCGEAGIRASFARGCQDAEVAVIEGVMGLFDGAAGDSDAGSTAEIARWLQGRILLVLDARAQARSAAALAQGFARFDPRLEFAGVVCNRVGSDRHARLLEAAFASVTGLPPLLGCLPRETEVALPARHLGLVTAGAAVPDEANYARLADWLERHVDVDRWFTLPPTPSHQGRGSWAEKPPSPLVEEGLGEEKAVRIAVARDDAFCFCYPENLELLQAAGAEIVGFSPLRDQGLPAGIDGLYLPGGYPELHADRLAVNGFLRTELREAAAGGLPIYAECGGLMLLAEAIDGQPMAGVFPGSARMLPRRKALGYREVTFTGDTPLGPAGTVVRGHEFHYSELELPAGIERCYRLRRGDGSDAGVEGYRSRNVLGSYVHLHFGSNPQVAKAFVDFCRRRAATSSGERA